MDGKKYPGSTFTKGAKNLNGTESMGFMKGLDTNYRPFTERNVRKHIILDSLVHKLMSLEADGNVSSLSNVFFLLAQRYVDGTIAADLDLSTIFGLGRKALETLKRGKSPVKNKGGLEIKENVFVVDPAIGDGGVQWVTASENPIMKRDLEEGLYGFKTSPIQAAMEKSYEVPTDPNANPYAKNLVRDYWPSVRKLIKDSLLGP